MKYVKSIDCYKYRSHFLPFMQAIIFTDHTECELEYGIESNYNCMTEIACKKLIDWTIESLLESGINSLIIVLGTKMSNNT